MNLRARCQHYGWLSAILLLLMAIRQTVSSETRVVCYYTNWSVYRPGTAKFSPQNINPYLCTHLIYAFGGFTKENSLKPFDKYQDIEKGGYAKFTGLKTYNKNLKTMLAIGGWNEGSSRFSPMVASPDRRKELVKNAVKFLRQNHFDGLDLDWEYPSFRDGGKTRDRENYAQLVQELREEFDRESEKTGRPRLLLTMAVPAGIEYINKGYDVPKLTKYLDWMNILSYDYHSAFEPAVNHHSPLYPLEEDNEYNFDADLNIDHTIKHYLKMGADPNKLVLGIPTYGRSYTLFNPDANEIGAPADGPGDMGDATRENGYLAFYEICENLKENDWKVVQPNPTAMGPYAYKGNQWVSYDDELIARKKSEYVVENNLGGIMFWSIDNDDFRGHCYNKPYPLIEAAKEALIAAATGKTENNLVSTSSKSRKPIINSRSRTRFTNTLTKKEESATTARVQNSGGRQGGNEISSSSGSRKRIRSGSRNKDREEEPVEEKEVKPQRRIKPRGSGRRRKTTTTAAPTTSTTTASILSQTTPSWKTPEPPTTPDPGGDFKCEEDGFFPHPRDCKKYFWCLSGPADLGIVAHQFTCPAGLYFNKAADSCDYTQNVLCKKNIKTTTTTAATTSATTTTPAPSTTTRRVPARITAATSRTTFLYTTTSTTTPEPEYYDDEYEYEDEEVEDSPRRGEPDSEEDPRVIKELIDLIKKVGGVEELEKYLNLQEDGTMAVTHSSGSTTPATISRSLYERVLSRANAGKNTNGSTKTQTRNSLTYSAINRNSRPGPQNAGIEKEEEDDSSKRGRPKYTTITRQRASTEKVIDTEPEEDEDDIEDNEEEVKSTRGRQFTSKKSNQPEYVTIRRSRPTTASEVEEDLPTRSSLRGRQRGIPGEEEDVSTGTQSPEYVTIRRSRPTTEETTTSKYATIQRRRPATESPEETESTIDSNLSKRRSTTITSEDTATTTVESEPSTFLANQEKLDEISGTINSIVEDEKEVVSTSQTVTTEGTTEPKSTIENSATETSTASQTTSDTAQSTTVLQNTKTNQIDSQTVTQESSSEKTSPQLFRPRPFATRTRGTTTSKPTTEVTESIIKPSSSRPLFFRRPSTYNYRKTTTSTEQPSTSTLTPTRSPGKRTPPRRRFTAPRDGLTPTAATTSTSKSVVTEISSQVSTTSKPRFKFASRRPYTKKTTSTTSTESTSTTAKDEEDDEENLSHDDQMIEPSIQRIRPHDQLAPNSINELNEKEELTQEPDESLELLGDIALTLNGFQKAPLPTNRFRGNTKATSTTERTTTTTSTQRNQGASFDRLSYRGRPQRTRISTTSRPEYYTTPITKAIITTTTTTTPVTINYNSLRRRRPQPFEKVTQVPVQQYTTGSYTPITIEYDYYDEGDVRIIGRLPANSKVLIHASGAIQCLDQGNFPHPVSCKKFISCAKMENGDVIGWEYTCPNRLSFDPVGGMCNWSAGLGCKE